MLTHENSLSLFLQEIKKYGSLSDKETVKLIRRYQKTKDTEDLQKVTLGHLGFVVSKAMKFKNRRLPISDLISAGTHGIAKAADKFDHKRDVKFSTYASYWVEMYMRREIIYNRSLVKITPRTWEMSVKISKMRKNGTLDKDIVKALNIRRKTLDSIRNLKNDISLNHTFDNANGGSTTDYCNLIPDAKPSPAEQCAKKDFRNYMLESVNKLNDREKSILVNRFGLTGNKRMTLRQLSLKYKITPERIRQLVELSLQKLKQNLDKDAVGDIATD